MQAVDLRARFAEKAVRAHRVRGAGAPLGGVGLNAREFSAQFGDLSVASDHRVREARGGGEEGPVRSTPADHIGDLFAGVVVVIAADAVDRANLSV